MISDLQADNSEFGRAIGSTNILFIRGGSEEIDKYIKNNKQVIVAYGNHLTHVRESGERHYLSVNEGFTISKAEVIGRRPDFMSFNFIILTDKI